MTRDSRSNPVFFNKTDANLECIEFQFDVNLFVVMFNYQTDLVLRYNGMFTNKWKFVVSN